MSKQVPIATQAEIDNTHFDFSRPVTIPNDPDAAQGVEFEVLERGSDTHIAFLEQALQDLQQTLDQLKKERERKAS